MRKEEEAESEVRVKGTDKPIFAIIATSLDTEQNTTGRIKLMKNEDISSMHPQQQSENMGGITRRSKLGRDLSSQH